MKPILALFFASCIAIHAQTNKISQIEWASQIAAKFESGQTNQLSRSEQVDLMNQMRWNYVDATEAVRKKLKDPTDAKFSEFGVDSEAICGPYGYHQWVCAGWVESLNSFGGKAREQWGVCIFRSDIACRIQYMRIGDSEYGRMTQKIPFPMPPEKANASTNTSAAKTKN